LRKITYPVGAGHFGIQRNLKIQLKQKTVVSVPLSDPLLELCDLRNAFFKKARQ